jgi:hypothetical protein
MVGLIAALLLSQGVQPEGLVGWQGFIAQGASSDVALEKTFPTPGCYASGTGGVFVSRATVANYENPPGTLNSCAAGSYRVEADGLLVESARTNYVLNATTHPKTGEATGSLSTGAHVAWHAGTGTMTVAAGTATVTGLTCTAVSPGTICSFTVTVAGTMSITTSAGTVARAQIENGLYPTSFITTAGTATARNADIPWVDAPLAADTDFAVLIGWRYGLSRDPGAATLSYLWGWDNTTTSNDQILFHSSATAITGRWYNSDNSTFRPVSFTHGYVAGSSHEILFTLSPYLRKLYSDGVEVTADTVTIDRTIATLPPALYFGGNNAGSAQLDGWVKRLKVCRTSNASRCK